VRPEHAEEFERLVGDVPFARIGTTGGRDLTLSGLFVVSLAEMRAAHQSRMPTLFEN
jgi:phosphoribosylformylglycinamidine synthase